ncbi:hypothetical protein SAMN05421543_10215 [Alicyclobacillus macrosporangiidus]|uniref:Uncharacterized protein n=2 Tax=Alicyclobacillus macrosporangiidus TaxID=392015 RepID=A0A1I7G629_9BACL|nr:hypothetical protein [Alicyclobacillus macrosporangiidus]SFU43868.1 hypothetical protein SAMN05421543_10215 [Alicyclobacillus macrosporangiidus]
MYDDALFAVEDPDTGQIGYCSVMGAIGEFFGLAVFPGEAGWRSLHRLMDDDEPSPAAEEERVYGQFALIASFEGSRDVTEQDRAVMKQLGLRFRGENAWPVFRSHRPGYVPWYLTRDEAKFLSIALSQATTVASRVRQQPDLLEPPQPNQILTRRRVQDGAAFEWIDVWTETPQITPPAPAVPTVRVDEVTLKRIRRQASRKGEWEVDIFYAPFVIQEGERPMFSKMLMCVDHASGMILQVHAAGHQTYAQESVDKLVEILRAGRCPEAFLIQRPEVGALLRPLAEGLGIELREEDWLPALEEAREALESGLA